MEGHLDRTHVLHICPWEVSSLFGALVETKEPAKELGMLLTPLLIVLHGQQRGLTDSQDVSGLQFEVLFLVFSKSVECLVLKTFCRHFDRVAKIKMATEERIRWRTSTTGTGSAEIFPQKPKSCRVSELGCWYSNSGGRGGRNHPQQRSISRVDMVALHCCGSLDLSGVGSLMHFP